LERRGPIAALKAEKIGACEASGLRDRARLPVSEVQRLLPPGLLALLDPLYQALEALALVVADGPGGHAAPGLTRAHARSEMSSVFTNTRRPIFMPMAFRKSSPKGVRVKKGSTV